jgi:hypothetical protein
MVWAHVAAHEHIQSPKQHFVEFSHPAASFVVGALQMINTRLRVCLKDQEGVLGGKARPPKLAHARHQAPGLLDSFSAVSPGMHRSVKLTLVTV